MTDLDETLETLEWGDPVRVIVADRIERANLPARRPAGFDGTPIEFLRTYSLQDAENRSLGDAFDDGTVSIRNTSPLTLFVPVEVALEGPADPFVEQPAVYLTEESLRLLDKANLRLVPAELVPRALRADYELSAFLSGGIVGAVVVVLIGWFT